MTDTHQQAEQNQQLLEKVNEIYALAAQADWATLETFLHSDFSVLEMDDVPYPGRYVGIDGFVDLFTTVFGTYDNLNLKHRAFCAGDDHVMVLLDFEGQNKDSGDAFSVPMIELFRFDQGKLIEIRPFYWNTKTLRDMAPKSVT